MKAGHQLFGSVLLGLCASIGCAGLVQAQISETNVTWQGTVSVVTISNVTYANYTWMLFGCDCESVFSTGPLSRKGVNFQYNFDLQEKVGPVACPQFIARITTSIVLGTLSPGNYTLTTTSWGTPVATNAFTIPIISAPPPTPVLCPIGFRPNGGFEIRMSNCDSNKSYVLQCSTNLVDWTLISTNSGGPPLVDPSPVSPGPHFYRVQILQN